MNKKGFSIQEKNTILILTILGLFSIYFLIVSNTGLFSLFNTNFIKNVDNTLNKEIPIYKNGEIINVEHTLDLENPRGRNNGGYVQYGVIFYYIDNNYLGGKQFGVSNNGNPKTSQTKFNSQNFILNDLNAGEHTFKSEFYVSRGGDTCGSGSPTNCGQRIEPQSNCVTGQTFTSTERYSDAVHNFMLYIPCQYKEGTSATGVIFPDGDDWSKLYTFDGYKQSFTNKFEVEVTATEKVLNWWEKIINSIKNFFNSLFK